MILSLVMEYLHDIVSGYGIFACFCLWLWNICMMLCLVIEYLQALSLVFEYLLDIFSDY